MKYDFAFQSLPFYIDANVVYLKKTILFSCKIKCYLFFPYFASKKAFEYWFGLHIKPAML